MICISIGNIDLIDQVNLLKPDLVEFRFDLIKEEPEIVLPLLNKDIGIVATCRPGYFTEEDRSRILKKCMSLGAKYIDIELESSDTFCQKLTDFAQKKSTRVIVSYHNFKITPEIDELKIIFRSCLRKGAGIVKIATQVNADIDNINLLRLYSEENARKVILGMGELGKITRLAALELDAEFTFASMEDNEATAPGQLTYRDLVLMKKILHAS